MQSNRGFVFAEEQARRRDRAMTTLPRKPGRGNEADRRQAEPGQESDAAIDSFTGRGLIEREKFAFACRAPPRAQRVARPAWKTGFIVSLTMQHDVGALRRAFPQPLHERRVTSEGPVTVPIGNHQAGPARSSDVRTSSTAVLPPERRRE